MCSHSYDFFIAERHKAKRATCVKCHPAGKFIRDLGSKVYFLLETGQLDTLCLESSRLKGGKPEFSTTHSPQTLEAQTATPIS